MTAVEVGLFGNDDSGEYGLIGSDVAGLYLGRLSLGEREDFFSAPLDHQDAKLRSMMWQDRNIDGLSSYDAYRNLSRLASFINGDERKIDFYYPLLGEGDSSRLAWANEDKFRHGINWILRKEIGLDEELDIPDISQSMPVEELLGFKLKARGQNRSLLVENKLQFRCEDKIILGSQFFFSKKRTVGNLFR